jgi:hypothetical protein
MKMNRLSLAMVKGLLWQIGAEKSKFKFQNLSKSAIPAESFSND